MRVQRLGPGAVGVVAAWHDAQLTPMGDEVCVPQSQRLPDPHAGLGEQDQQEAVPQVLTGLHKGEHLLVGQGAGQAALLAQPQRPGRYRVGRR